MIRWVLKWKSLWIDLSLLLTLASMLQTLFRILSWKMAGILLIAVLISALIFEFINGFHDTANAIATTVYTKALPLRTAIIMSAIIRLYRHMSERIACDHCIWTVDIQLQLTLFCCTDGRHCLGPLCLVVLNPKFIFACAYWQPYWRNHRIYRQHGPHLGGLSRRVVIHSVYLASWVWPELLWSWYLRSLLLAT